MAVELVTITDDDGWMTTVEPPPIEDDEFYMHYPSIKASFICCYGIIFLAGLLSNIIMLIVGIRNWWTIPDIGNFSSNNRFTSANSTMAVTNLLVANLAAGDIVLCIFSAPSTPFSYYFPNWPLGEFACRFLPSTLITAVCIISFTSTVLAVDRHLAICYPSEKRLTVRWTFITIVLIWFVSIVFSVPTFLAQQLVAVDDPEETTIYECRENWPSIVVQRIFSMSTLLIQFGLPFAVIFYCYGAIFLVIRAQDNFRAKATTQSSSFGHLRHSLSNESNNNKSSIKATSSAQMSSSNNNNNSCFGNCAIVSLMFDVRFMRTTRILLSMISVFMASWLPINCLHLIQDYFFPNLWGTTRWYSFVYFCAHVLAMSSTVFNPLLYGWMNENFRKELVRAFSIVSSVKRDSIFSRVFFNNSGNHNAASNINNDRAITSRRETVASNNNSFINILPCHITVSGHQPSDDTSQSQRNTTTTTLIISSISNNNNEDDDELAEKADETTPLETLNKNKNENIPFSNRNSHTGYYNITGKTALARALTR